MTSSTGALLGVLVVGSALGPAHVPLAWLAAVLADRSKRYRRPVTAFALSVCLLMGAQRGVVWWLSFEQMPGHVDPSWVLPAVVVLACAIALGMVVQLALAIALMGSCLRHSLIGLRATTWHSA